MIGENIRRLLNESGIEHLEFSEMVGISKTHLSYLINNKREPSMHILRKMSEILNVSMEEFFKGNGIIENAENVRYAKVIQDAKKAGITPEKLAKLVEFLETE